MKINGERWIVVTPWHSLPQRDKFLAAWGNPSADELLLVQDTTQAGCARTKNRGVAEAIGAGFDGVVILDDDCFPDKAAGIHSLGALVRAHVAAMEPQPVSMIAQVTAPMSRGTPYYSRHVTMPVAASMGFWTYIGDYDAPGQLVHGATKPMEFIKEPVFGRYFPLCGMNLAFRPKQWLPWCSFIDVPRMDDIWMGWLFERAAYDQGYCFNLGGPVVRHSRQSNVWANLRDEALYLEENETLWHKIATSPAKDFDTLRALVPIPREH